MIAELIHKSTQFMQMRDAVCVRIRHSAFVESDILSCRLGGHRERPNEHPHF